MKLLDCAYIKWYAIALIIVQAFFWLRAAWVLFYDPNLLTYHPDFWVFYASGLLAGEGRAVAAYDISEVHFALKSLYPDFVHVSGWYYPPVYFFLVEMLPTFPYPVSYVLWSVCTGAFFFWTIRPLVKNADEWWLLLAAPAVFVNINFGQNAFVTAGLMALAYRYLMARQVLAGVAVGLLCIKPHFALLLPVAMLAYRRWVAILSAAVTVAALALASAARYGVETWKVFFTANAPSLAQFALGDAAFEELSIYLERVNEGLHPAQSRWGGISSIHVQAQFFGAPPEWAMGLQALFTFGVMLCIVYLAHRQAPYRLVMAFLLAATLPVSPHNYSYDWVITLLPMLLFWREIETADAKDSEKIILIAMFFTPFYLMNIGQGLLQAPFGLLVILALLYAIARRAYVMQKK